MAQPAIAPTADLVPLVPRLTLEWLRDHPQRLWLEREGTLALVDISGFTAMSERLSSRGKAGAEELTEIMNRTFAALLEVAYAAGGGLLKFGGDALLLHFEGEDHAERAAQAAFGMRRTLRRIGRPRTAAGAVTLRMHAGIHSGAIQFFLVGSSHRELLVVGPAATRTVELEVASEAGEILLSPETASRLDPSYLGDEKGPGQLLEAEPPRRGRVVPLPDVSDVPLEIALPASLRAQLQEVGPLEGEHRNAAVAFIRFGGVDETIGTDGLEATAEALDAMVAAIQEAAAEHDVTFLESDVDRDGGRIVLVAGAPQTFGQDEERLLRTLRASVDRGLPFPVHVGAGRGRVFTGQVGAPFRRTYTLLGDTAALAARLMARAGEDEIYVAAAAFERGGAAFAAEPLDPFEVKGKSELVHALVLGELVATSAESPERPPPSDVPFVDRERERAVLGAAVAPVSMGFGTLVELIGEPGIGKSRLAEELEEHCAEMTKLSARCDQYEAATPYYPFRSLLRGVLGVELGASGEENRASLMGRLAEVDDELVQWAPLLAAPLDVEIATTAKVDELDPAFRRARLHGVVGKLLGQLLGAPTLLLFEDVHWMDDASADLLRHLGTQLPTRPWLTCTTRRPAGGGFLAAEGTPPLPALTLRLEPLPAEDAKTLVRAAAGSRRMSDRELAAVMERGAGNPLFLQELASVKEASEQVEELPETVEALVATRIDELSPGDRALLRWASVLGVAFSGALIGEVLEADPSVAPASEAWGRLGEFVEFDPETPGGFRFRHALIRDAAYEGLSYKRRRELHARVAEVIERRQGERPEEVAEVLSLHFTRAEQWSQAWRYSIEAGHRAQSKWANLEAAEFYRRALDAARHLKATAPGEIASAWEALGDCLQLAGNLGDAAHAFRRARALIPRDAAEHIELMHKEGSLRDAMGEYAQAIRWYGRALKAADAIVDDQARARLTLELRVSHAAVRFRQGAFQDCIERCRNVVADAIAVGDLFQLGRAYLLLHSAYNATGSPERVAVRGLALPIFEELGDLERQATVLNNLGIDAYFEGEWDKALDVYERARALFERIGDVASVAMTTNNIGEILSDRGRLNEAEALFEAVRDAVDPTGHRGLAMIARLNLGRAAARAGRFDDADALIIEAHTGFTAMHAESFVLESEARRAESDVLRGDRAAEVLVRVDAVLALTGDAAETAALRAVCLRVRGGALLQLGRRDEASIDLRAGVRVAREAGLAYETALALDLLATAAEEPSAAEESRSLLERLKVECVARPPH